MTNYYELLNVDTTALANEIEMAIKAERRLWNNRSNNPSAQIRAEAEQRISQIAEAEKTLLDPVKRATYNIDLQNTPPPQQNMPADNDGGDWEERAKRYFEAGEYSSLSILTRDITQAKPHNNEAWYWRGLAEQKQDNVADAKYSLSRAIELAPNEHRYYSTMGEVYGDNGEMEDAYKYFRKAADLLPQIADYELMCALCLKEMKRYDEALALAKEGYTYDNDDPLAQRLYALTLYYKTMQSISFDSLANDYYVTNARQLEFLKGKMPEFYAIKADDEQARQTIAEVKGKIDNAEKKQYVGSDMIALWIITALLGLLFLPPGLIWIAAVIAIYIPTHYKPSWKWRWKLSKIEVKRSGLQ